MSFMMLGSLLIGLAVITGLIKEGELGCLGVVLLVLLVCLLIGGLLVTLLVSMGGF